MEDPPFPPGSPSSMFGRNVTPIPSIPRAMNYRPPRNSETPSPPRRPSPPTSRDSPLPPIPQAAVPEGEARMVIAVDYGTTFTGVAYLSIKNKELENNPNALADEIRVIDQWPRNTTGYKVPSDISYSPSGGGACQQWGYDIDDHSRVIKWSKLDLEETPSKTTELNKLTDLLWEIVHVDLSDEMVGVNKIPRHIIKGPEAVVTDYLGKIAEKTVDEIVSVVGKHVPDRVPIDMVVTHPAKWSNRALNSTFRAIRTAFDDTRFSRIRNISFVTEPEACAHYTLREAWQQDRVRFRRNDAFIVVDAGGGTVDLATYKIASIDYETKQIKLEQIGVPIGCRCGATFIDKAFLEFVRQRLGDEDWDKLNYTDSKEDATGGHNIVKPGVRILQKRFEPIKQTFDGKGPNLDHPIQLPRGIGAADDPDRGIAAGSLKVSPDDLRKMFKHSITQTLALIARAKTQIDMDGDMGGARVHLRTIYLSGGFAQNPYLFDKVKQWGSTQSIDVERGGDCWAAVSRGAILKSLGLYTDKLPIVRHCPRHYGIKVKSQYEQWKPSHNSAEIDIEGTRWATGQIRWLVRKGDAIFPGRPIILANDCNWLLPPMRGQNGRGPDPQSEDWAKKEVIFIASGEDSASLSIDGLNPSLSQQIRLVCDLSNPNVDREDGVNERGERYSKVYVRIEISVQDRVLVKITSKDVVLAERELSL